MADGAADSLARVRALIAAEPRSAAVAGPGGENATLGTLERLCRAAVRSLPAFEVGLSIVTGDDVFAMVTASRTSGPAIEQLQFTLGEGPGLEAVSHGRPVLIADLTKSPVAARWPAYAPAVGALGVRAVFAFPMQVGAVCLGALDVYNDTAGRMSDRALEQATSYADTAMSTILDEQAQIEDGEQSASVDEALESMAVVYQAQGMVMIRLGITLAEAMIRIRAYAFASGRGLAGTAHDIVHRGLDIGIAPSPPDSTGQ